MVEFESYRLDTINQCLWRRQDHGQTRVSLTPKSFAVLRYLVESAGRLVSQDELLDTVWNGTFVQPEVIKNQILDIRAALGDHPKNPKFIETLPKRGYRFIAPLHDLSKNATAFSESDHRRLVGRQSEWSELNRCLQMSLKNQRQIIFVTGEPGIGKTAVVDEFLRRTAVDSRDVRVVRGQCIEGYAGKEPYYPVLEALGQLCGGPEKESVVRVLASRAPTWLVQFPVLIQEKQREMLQREILGATRERMLREIVDALDVIAAERPLLLVIDDLHWADASTVDLISALARGGEPSKLMLLGAYRPADVTLSDHPLKAVAQDLEMRGACHEIALDPLGEFEVAEYLAMDAEGAPLPEGLAGLLHRHCEGNPLFMVTALNHMRDRGLIALEEGTWTLKVPLEKINVEAPDTLRRMIELQIDRLSPEEQRALEVASVLRRFSMSVLIGAAVADVAPDTFEESLEGLARKHRVVRQAGVRHHRHGTFACYEFVHVLFRQVVYGRMGPARRKRLHLSMAEKAEALTAYSEAEVVAELAYHFEEGEDWLRAVKYLRLAADIAGRRFEPMQAAAIMEHALELMRRLPEADRASTELEILERLGAIYVVRFDPRSVSAYEAMIERARHYGRIDIEIRGEFAMGLQLHRVSAERYVASLERALKCSAQQKSPERERTQRAYRLYRLFANWNAVDAEDLVTEYAEVRRSGEPIDLRLLMFYSLLHYYSARYHEAIRLAKEAFDRTMRESGQNPYFSDIFMMYQQMISPMHTFAGEWGIGLREAVTHAETATKNGNLVQANGGARADLAWLHVQALDFDCAYEICESLLPFLNSPLLLGRKRFCRVIAALADLGRARYDCSLEELQAVRDEMLKNPMMQDRHSRMFLGWGLTNVWLAKGDLEQARGAGEAFLKIVLNDRTWEALALEANARVRIAERNLDAAQDYIDAALKLVEEFELPLAHWRVHGTAADLQMRLGNRDLAHVYRERSRGTILKLADSLPPGERLRTVFLSAPITRELVGSSAEIHPAQA
jgi:DNA-binding winged helix-turn-helix (wHTH) protein